MELAALIVSAHPYLSRFDYDNYPEWATEYDKLSSLEDRIGDIHYEPLNEQVVNFHYFVSTGAKVKPFSHKFKSGRKFREFKATACVNDEVNLFAKHTIEKAGLGTDAVTDLLTLTYYAGTYDHQSAIGYGMEMQDTYARLDRQLEELFDFIDEKVDALRGYQHRLLRFRRDDGLEQVPHPYRCLLHHEGTSSAQHVPHRRLRAGQLC